MEPRDWLWLGSLLIGGFVVWQNSNISLAVERLRSELIERIAKTEGDVKALSAKQ